MDTITPCLWFDTEGEEAANFYSSLFPNSRILSVARYGEGAPRPAEMVMTVSFELDGRSYLALNGGPEFKFSEAVSFQVTCASQEEVDRYWNALTEGGQEGPCGWLRTATESPGRSFQALCPRCSAIPTGESRNGSCRRC